MLHVVFAGPQDHDRFAGSLGDLRSFHHEVGLVPPAEAAAHERGVHDDFFRRELGDFGDHALGPLRALGGHPGFRAVCLNVHGAIHGLHANVSGKRQLVHSFELF